MNRKFSKLETLSDDEAFSIIIKLLNDMNKLLDNYLSFEEISQITQEVDYIKNQTRLRKVYRTLNIDYLSNLN
jgi:hypothetical protein